MKAKEYIAKYKAGFESGNDEMETKAATALLLEMSNEAMQIMQKRGVKRDSAVVAVLEEQNAKWNTCVSAYPDILARNGFKAFWLNRMPELEKVWR